MARRTFPSELPTASGGKPPARAPGVSPFAGLLAEAQGSNPEAGPPGAPTVPAGAAPALAAPELSEEPSLSERRVGPYRVLGELGAGGMAVVYKAVQPSLDRLVAIKELRAEYVHDRQIATRFEREATSLATLQHGNIVHVYDYLRDEESAYIVMEFVDGIDLFDVLAEGGKMPPEIAASIAEQVAEGLEYAHYRGIVHRDIKPSNILVSKRGEVKIMDFGIARDPGKSELTQIGLAVGTPAYMAPEQIRGDRIDFRTDVFALGIVLFEMLTGRKPWSEEDGRSVTVRVLDEPHPSLRAVLPDAPAELERIIDRCLAKDPNGRYRTTFELRRDLELFLERTLRSEPRTRLVLYLRNRNLLSEGEASNFVQPDLLEDAAVRCRDEGIPLPPPELLVRPVAIAAAVALVLTAAAAVLSVSWPVGTPLPPPPLMALALAGELDVEAEVESTGAEPVAAAPGAEPGGPRLGVLARAPRAALKGDEGFVKVVVKPWARVFVDGEFYDYTPFADPIPLAPGRRRIGLRNPHYEAVDRYVDVETGKTLDLKLVLEKKPAGAPDGR